MNLKQKMRLVVKDTLGRDIEANYYHGNDVICSRLVLNSSDGEDVISISKNELIKVMRELIYVL